ncbi:MAG: hypothetical protein AB7O96_05780 [Pseudobdellovibrionaceae bacterium]
MKFRLLFLLATMCLSLESYSTPNFPSDALKFSCEFKRGIFGDIGNSPDAPYTPDKVYVSFSPNGEFLSAVRVLDEPLRNGVKKIELNTQNAKLEYAKETDSYTYAFVIRDLGEGLSAAISFRVATYRGVKLTPLQSMVAIEFPEVAHLAGKLRFQFHNSKFPATWTEVFTCKPTEHACQ